MSWLGSFAEAAARTDRFIGNRDHARLLAVGLMGEAGSVVAELKKEQREREAYPAYRQKMLEELGDLLWYFVRLVCVVTPDLMPELEPAASRHSQHETSALPVFLRLGAAVGRVLDAMSKPAAASGDLKSALREVWTILRVVSIETHTGLEEAAAADISKIESRWRVPADRGYEALFDDGFPEEEQLPRRLDIEFRERARGVVILRCNGINFGDRLTDNIEDPDGYRFHDVFHFAYAVHVGWSPVVRALLKCKRKSNSKVDEAQDGARAAIIEEAVSAIAFSRAKQLNFFDGMDHVDYDLLKTIKEFVEGYEVDRIPLWQWEVAILEGFRIFRQLRQNRGGRVLLDVARREVKFVAPLRV
jgi:NTP pyrophosphatase (non-canonical NTP hydrolase)